MISYPVRYYNIHNPPHLNVLKEEKSMVNEYEIKKQICDIGRRIYNRNMVAANDGNISVKLNDNEFLCTPTGVSKGFMTPEFICKVDAKGNAVADVSGKDAVVKAGNNLDDTRIRTDGNRVYVVGNGGFSMDFLLSDQIDTTAGSKDLQMDVTEIGSMTIQIGSNQYQEMAVRIPEVSSETLYLDTVDVTVAGGADRAISTLDDAIAYVSSVRSRMGSFENRLEYATNSLGETEENMTSAYSNLVDADMATEMTEYASQNILDQAGISVLSQANDLPQQVLSLLSK